MPVPMRAVPGPRSAERAEASRIRCARCALRVRLWHRPAIVRQRAARHSRAGRMLRSAVRRELAWIALALTALTAVMTHPLLVGAAHALPHDLGDPLLNSFILGWDADRALHGFRGLWSAPFFFPQRDTLALSEHLLGVAIFTSPVVWVTRNPILAHNLAFFASYVLAGLGMYLLARSLWGRRDAACLAALAFAFAPYRVMHLPHLQILMSGWMPRQPLGAARLLRDRVAAVAGGVRRGIRAARAVERLLPVLLLGPCAPSHRRARRACVRLAGRRRARRRDARRDAGESRTRRAGDSRRHRPGGARLSPRAADLWLPALGRGDGGIQRPVGRRVPDSRRAVGVEGRAPRRRGRAHALSRRDDRGAGSPRRALVAEAGARRPDGSARPDGDGSSGPTPPSWRPGSGSRPGPRFRGPTGCSSASCQASTGCGCRRGSS